MEGESQIKIATETAEGYSVQTCETGVPSNFVPGVTDFENSATDTDDPNS